MGITRIKAWLKNPDTRTAEKALYASVALTFFCLPLGTAPPTITGLVATAIWLFSGIAAAQRPVYAASYWWPVYALALLPWIGLLYTCDTTGTALVYAAKSYYWLFGLVVAAIPFQRMGFLPLVQAFMAGLALNVIAASIQIVFKLTDENNWHLGLGPDYSTLSAYLIIGILLGIFFLSQTQRPRQQIALIGLITLYFLHFVLLRSRASYVALVLLTPFIGITFFHRKKLIKTTVICILIPVLMMISPVVRNRIELTVDQLKFHLFSRDEAALGKKYTVNQDRFFMWNGAAKIIAQHPWIGVGTAGYATALASMEIDSGAPRIVHPHNNFLYMAVSYGVVGLAFFLWFLINTLRHGWRQRHTAQGFMLLSVILVMATSGLFNSQILDVGSAFLISLAVGFHTTANPRQDPAQTLTRMTMKE